MARPIVRRILALRLWLTERFRPGEQQVTLFWAGLIGCVGGVSGLAFRTLTDRLQRLFTGSDLNLVEAAASLEWWQRLCVPAVGGLIAGLVLHFGSRITQGRRSADYMEAISLGDGVIRSRPTLVKVVSSLFSIASGGSIGREGPMVQLSAMLASLVGRFADFPKPRLRLLVACGAAAGIASAYNAPIGGALFVAEIVLGSIAMESFGPLILSSVMATITARSLIGPGPLFEIPTFRLVSPYELVPYLLLGLIAGTLAPWFLTLLRRSTLLFAAIPLPIYGRMAVGGLIVGVLSVGRPDVWGNGYRAISSILQADWLWAPLVMVLVSKLIATASTVGSGAVGGVFTPTLFVGAVIGSLIGLPVHAQFPNATAPANAYALVGMGAFLAATTHAPLMAILILFEMTLDYEIVLPLMIAAVTAYTTAYAIKPESLYSHSLKPKEPEAQPVPLEALRVRDLMKPDPPSVTNTARMSEILETFVKNRHHNLYVVSAGQQFRGVIPLHEVKPYLNDSELAKMVIAEDLLHEEFPVVTPDEQLRETLNKFSTHQSERLPVVDALETRRLVGSISKTDLLLTLAHGVAAGQVGATAAPAR